MRRFDPDVWAAALITALCVLTAVPVMVIQLSGGDPIVGPAALWWALFAGYVVALQGTMVGTETLSRRALRAVFGAQLVLGPTVVLLAPALGFLPILLVFTTALSAYVISRAGTAVVGVGNSAVAGAAAWLLRADPFETVMVALLYLLIQGVSVLAIVSQQRDQDSRTQLAAAHTELRATSALLADASRSAERLRIARDLHDVVGHQVTALALELEIASHQATGPAAEHVTRARGIAKDLLTDVRHAVGELRAEEPDVRTALTTIVADLPAPQVHLAVDDDLTVDADRLTTLVRCVQEIVTNTIRHAGAQQLWIDVCGDVDGTIRLRARDDGRGAGDASEGNGLTGMRERVTRHGGALTVDGRRGFEVVASVPAS